MSTEWRITDINGTESFDFTGTEEECQQYIYDELLMRGSQARYYSPKIGWVAYEQRKNTKEEM
jgi:hypothetical protein